jgi:molecular chaperone GrpE
LEQNKDSAQFAQGVRAIHMAMEMLLNRFGVSEIKPQATDPFNPDEHEAIRTEEREELEQSQMELVRVGYRIGRRILRPAQVCLIKPVDSATNGEK